MKPERRQKLDTIGFVWDARIASWEEGFGMLLQFKEAEGHCKVPMGFKLKNYNLGQWVSTQRKKMDSLSSDRIQRLDDIGFVWHARKGKT
jgi:hypothetical protein